MASDLADIITSHLAECGGPIGFLGASLLGREISRATGPLFIIDQHSSRKKIGRPGEGCRVARGDALFPPFRHESLAGLVVAGELGRQVKGARAVGAWCDLIKPGGTLVVVEPETAPPILGSLRRLFASGPPHRPPEQVSALFLNAGLCRVGQRETEGRRRLIISLGYKGALAVASQS